jgi:hypothetical protein
MSTRISLKIFNSGDLVRINCSAPLFLEQDLNEIPWCVADRIEYAESGDLALIVNENPRAGRVEILHSRHQRRWIWSDYLIIVEDVNV